VPPKRAAFRFNRRTYAWRRADQRLELMTAGRVVALVVPDRDYACMWRIDFGDGALSDMVNLSRAKDAALHRADRAIENGRQRPSGAPPIAQGATGCSTLPESESLTSEPAVALATTDDEP
jgi:hypothetical protein